MVKMITIYKTWEKKIIPESWFDLGSLVWRERIWTGPERGSGIKWRSVFQVKWIMQVKIFSAGLQLLYRGIASGQEQW